MIAGLNLVGWFSVTFSTFDFWPFLKSILSPLKVIFWSCMPCSANKWVSRKTHYRFLRRKLVNERTINAPLFSKQLQRSKHEPTVSDFHCQAFCAERTSACDWSVAIARLPLPTLCTQMKALKHRFLWRTLITQCCTHNFGLRWSSSEGL